MHAYLIVLTGGSVGKTYKLLDDEFTLGRSMESTIRLDNDGVSREHCRIVRSEKGKMTISDLKSTNGTYINGVQIDSHTLADGDRIQLGASTTLKFSYQDVVEEQFQKQLYDSATRDDLTDLHNKRFFNEQLGKDFSHAVRHDRPLSLLMIDVDLFKKVNDTYGHVAGDVILQAIGAAVLAAIRNEDLVCRVGGEEFAIVLRDANVEDAHTLAERLRNLVESTKVTHGKDKLSATISIGVSTLDRARHENPQALIEEADKHLYAAKRGGRNCVHPVLAS